MGAGSVSPARNYSRTGLSPITGPGIGASWPVNGPSWTTSRKRAVLMIAELTDFSGKVRNAAVAVM